MRNADNRQKGVCLALKMDDEEALTAWYIHVIEVALRGELNAC
jgi:hypothetical protein